MGCHIISPSKWAELALSQYAAEASQSFDVSKVVVKLRGCHVVRRRLP
jgi:hypothetical protein